jgi:hypothetical protein
MIFSLNIFGQSETLIDTNNIKFERVFGSDNLLSVKKFYDNGNLNYNGYYFIDSDGELHKHLDWVYYNNEGNKVAEGQYDGYDRKKGEWSYWDNDGRLIAEIHYRGGKIKKGYIWDKESGLIAKN